MKWYMVQGCVKRWDVVLCVVRGFGKNNSTWFAMFSGRKLWYTGMGYNNTVWCAVFCDTGVWYGVQEYSSLVWC